MSGAGWDGLTRAERAAIRERRAEEKRTWRARGSFGAASPCRRICPATGAVIDEDVAASNAISARDKNDIMSDLEKQGDER